MTAPRRVLIFGGLVLAAIGMLYGLHYAIFVEHQTLDGMGALLTSAFIHAANRDAPAARGAVDAYAAARYDYVRQVDVHSHWIGLAMLLIILGAACDYIAFSERFRLLLAITLLAGSFLFPLGVILQTVSHGARLGSALAVLGAAAVAGALGIVAIGFLRPSARAV